MSERALVEFVTWFLRVAVDQVVFMSSLFDLDALASRMRTFIAQRDLKPEAARLLQTLVRGEVERGEASRITGFPERSARRVLNDLTREGLLASDTPKGPLSLRFPTIASTCFFRVCTWRRLPRALTDDSTWPAGETPRYSPPSQTLQDMTSLRKCLVSPHFDALRNGWFAHVLSLMGLLPWQP